jgi:hypothetical protein
MRSLFDTGYQFAASGKGWRDTPPGVEPDEQRLPRAGVFFATTAEAVTADPMALPAGHQQPK